MAEGTGRLIGRLINLVLLGAILVGAWYAYQHFVVLPNREIEARREVIQQMDAKEWDAALAALDRLAARSKAETFIKEQRFVCYQAKANAANEQANRAETRHALNKDKDPAAVAAAKAEMQRLSRQCLECLEQAEKYGALKRNDIMNRANAYQRLGDQQAARKWSSALSNYPD